MLLPAERIRRIYAAAIDARLTEQRDVLFAGVDKHFVGGLPRASAASSQLLMDLHRMNEVESLTDGSVPFEAWLSQAVTITTSSPQHQELRDALGELQRATHRVQRPVGGSGGGGPARFPRRHFLDEVPFDFSRPEAQSLWAVLEQNLYRVEDTVALLDKAGVSKSHIRLDLAPRARWRDVLESAAQQGRLRHLVETLAVDRVWAGLRDLLQELLGSSPPAEVGPAPIAWKATTPVRGEERLRNKKPTWVDVAFLAKGLFCARSIVRVSAFFAGEHLLGTGFFIAPGRVLTNHHVLFQGSVAADRVILWLDYEFRPDGSLPSPEAVTIVEPEIQGEATHDWATLEVRDERARRVPALLLGSPRAVAAGDYVSIIQHPHGLPKKLGIFGSEVRHVDDDVIQYLTDTEQGSSGSPVFNDRWEVVALHHMWTLAGQDGGAPEIRNEGVHIDRVIEALRGRKLLA